MVEPHSQGAHPSAHETPVHRRIFDWIVEAFGELNVDWHFVGGYQVEEVVRAYPRINYSFNPDWRDTGSCASLFTAQIDAERTHFVSYADIVFDNQAVDQLCQASGDVVIAVDATWMDRYERRSLADIELAEKVCLDEDRVTAIGSNIEWRHANAEFVGLVKLSPSAMRIVLEIRQNELHEFKTAPLPALISRLKELGETIRAIDVGGRWADNAPQDLARYVLGNVKPYPARLMVRGLIGEQIRFPFTMGVSLKSVINRVKIFWGCHLAIRRRAGGRRLTNSNAGVSSLTNIPSGGGSD